MSAPRNCGHCKYLTRTSPEQVFLLCEFWSAESIPVKGAAEHFGYEWVVGHCHMQPEAPACQFFEAKGAADADAA